VLALDLWVVSWLALRVLSVGVYYAIETYGAAGDTVKALLALDGHVSAVGSLELDIKGGCIRASVCRVHVHSLSRSSRDR